MPLLSALSQLLKSLRSSSIAELVNIIDAEFRNDPAATKCNNEYFNNYVHRYLKTLGWAVHQKNVLWVKKDAPSDFDSHDDEIFTDEQDAVNTIPTIGDNKPSVTNPYVIVADPTADFSIVDWTAHVTAGTRKYIRVFQWDGPAVAGRASRSVAGNVDVTLGLAEYNQPIIELIGALTGNIFVIVPLIDGKQWAIFNNTTGAFNLTIKGTGGGGVVIAQGKRAIVYSDGANIIRLTADAV
jgi:hypothetical protein